MVSQVVAVVSHKNNELARLFSEEPIEVAFNENAVRGMESSLARGVKVADAAGWLIALADMLFIPPATISQMRRCLDQGAAFAAPVYQDQRRHPMAFSRRYNQELLALDDDQGARKVLARYRSELQLVEVNDRGILMDIDCPEDLVGIYRQANSF